MGHINGQKFHPPHVHGGHLLASPGSKGALWEIEAKLQTALAYDQYAGSLRPAKHSAVPLLEFHGQLPSLRKL
jgi:hypothetical protein